MEEEQVIDSTNPFNHNNQINHNIYANSSIILKYHKDGYQG